MILLSRLTNDISCAYGCQNKQTASLMMTKNSYVKDFTIFNNYIDKSSNLNLISGVAMEFSTGVKR